MAITDVIPREQGAFLDEHGDFVHSDPHLQTVFEQHACVIPETVSMLTRQAPPLFNGLTPDPMIDRNKNMFIPELLDGWITDPADPAFVGFPTPDRVPLDPANPDHVLVGRKGFRRVNLPTPVGPVEVWPFEDIINEPAGEPPWPSEPIRVRQGQLVHTRVETRENTHTVHHHAIEPSAMNDGVGHITFEVSSGTYDYQWYAAEAGTYFYHCHKNTTLHFEMGMYGYLIIDPVPPPGSDLTAPYVTGGAGYIQRVNDLVRYDVEALWAVDEFDRSWRTAENQHGVSVGIECPWYHVDENGVPTGEPRLPFNRFNPDVFLISGIANEWTMPGASGSPFPNGAAIFASRGQKILLRLLNAGYCMQRYTFGVPFEVVSVDGRTLGFSDFMQYSRPFSVPANRTFKLSTARRWDMLIDTATLAAGSYPVKIEFFDWISGQKRGEIQSLVVVS